MFWPFLFVVLGFVFLIIGANSMVNGASALAKKFNVSDLVIGLTIVAFGTSAPELVVSVIGSINNYSDIVLGNVIGSNNFNLFIILGLSGLIVPIKVQSSTAWKEIPISLVVSVLLFFLLNGFAVTEYGRLNRVEAVILLVLFCAFLYYVFKQMQSDSLEQNTHDNNKTLLKIWGLIIGGLTGLVIGGQLVVVYSVDIAHNLGVSEKIIGLTIVAAGTSLPELVTSIVASLKKNSDIAIGNVIGSNIFNILLILAISGTIKPITYNYKFNIDILVLIGGTVFLLIAMMTGKRKVLDRWEALILLCFYIIYTLTIVIPAT
ncbi:calcium/sodium antiporter [Plebeiibacterium sediminum]|uniref:Calcium/sodium antiporter n=1 Tax=Plebeiibacterium sediminum TaxID=2992112 RepID=A0AAE3SGK8_9BACT|nr:calcium/sodium antiporter [Plebeiobacterium sediminum]MCW3788207.1 calcium/sodium antiporter [Plebeiobacterium sediminum]